jgi:ABC-2 type transport system permease protein
MSTATLDRPLGLAPAPTVPADRRIPFSRLVRVEWRKATDTRAARWVIAISAIGTALLMLAPLLAKNSVDQTYGSYLTFAAFGLGSLLPLVSILTLTTEWTQRTVLTTFTQEPRRERVIGAKVAVSALMALAAIVYGGVVTAAALGIASATGRDLTADLGAAKIIGFALFVIVNIGMGVAFGGLLHNTPAAVVLFYVLPTAFGILGSAVSAVRRWIDPGTTFDWMLNGQLHGHLGNILLSALIWLVLPLIAGLVRTARREIK